MNTIINPKLLSLVQTIFYSCALVVIPLLVSALGVDGALYAFLPKVVTQYGIAGALIWILNYYDNKIQARTGNAFFGTIA